MLANIEYKFCGCINWIHVTQNQLCVVWWFLKKNSIIKKLSLNLFLTVLVSSYLHESSCAIKKGCVIIRCYCSLTIIIVFYYCLLFYLKLGLPFFPELIILNSFRKGSVRSLRIYVDPEKNRNAFLKFQTN